MMVVRGRDLVAQASDRLEAMEVEHTILMAGHSYDGKKHVVVASIDTINARNIIPEANLIVLDEVHYATSDSYKDFAANYPDAYFLGVTATPFVKKSLRHVADVIVKPITFQGLVDLGYLAPPEYRIAKPIDTSRVATSKSTGDFVSADLAESAMPVIGDVVESYNRFGESRPAICFAINIRHAEGITEQFQRSGIKCGMIQARDNDDVRERAIDQLRSGEIKVLVNVGILAVGSDLPFVSCIISARPTMSYNLYIQQMGRGARLCPERNKKDFIIIDNGGNVLRHGLITFDRTATLDGTDSLPLKAVEREDAAATAEVALCKACFAAFRKALGRCPACGEDLPKPEGRKIKPKANDGYIVIGKDGELPEGMRLDTDMARARAAYYRLKTIQEIKRLKPGFVYHKLREQFGHDIAAKLCLRRPETFGINCRTSKPC